ncbi:hypothetical protein A9K55_005377 [Cordyceps militaris]|uniref:Uncharacterized protein n=1 Tax=Cordyceps militaris TaxID=73501 RepID=A0A2H4SNU4_CORMI|nr:hypothetical protein A9K55_005377 [Cordyceps militaris]
MKFSVALTTVFIGFTVAGPMAKRDLGDNPNLSTRQVDSNGFATGPGLVSAPAAASPEDEIPSFSGLINPADFGIGPPRKTKRALSDDSNLATRQVDSNGFATGPGLVSAPEVASPEDEIPSFSGLINPADFGIGPPRKTKRALGDDSNLATRQVDSNGFATGPGLVSAPEVASPEDEIPSFSGVINPADFGIGPPRGNHAVRVSRN